MRLYDGLCGRGLTNTAQSTHWSHRPSQLKVQKEKYVYNISKECNQRPSSSQCGRVACPRPPIVLAGLHHLDRNESDIEHPATVKQIRKKSDDENDARNPVGREELFPMHRSTHTTPKDGDVTYEGGKLPRLGEKK